MSEEIKDNVVQFPQTSNHMPPPVGEESKAPGEPIVPSEEKMAKNQEFVLGLIEKNRKKGIQQLGHKLEVLTNRELNPEPKTEEALRDIQGGLTAILTHMEAGSSLVDYIKHDLLSVIQNMEGFGQQGFQTAAHLQCLIAVLIKKGIITHEEMKETWEEVIRPKAEALATGQQPDSGPRIV